MFNFIKRLFCSDPSRITWRESFTGSNIWLGYDGEDDRVATVVRSARSGLFHAAVNRRDVGSALTLATAKETAERAWRNNTRRK